MTRPTRRTLTWITALCAIALSWAGAAPAGDPDVPERYVKVDEVKARLDLGQMVRFVDVRPREQYDLLHIRGALNNGLSKEQIREVFLQVAIYCGVPAAVVSFRCAKEVFKERGV